jgi:hypothetical protein
MTKTKMSAGFTDWNHVVGHIPRTDACVGVAVGEERHAAAGLLEGQPEEGVEHREE